MTSHAIDHRPNARYWITYGGKCFHTNPDCPALAAGQDKARLAGWHPWLVITTGAEGTRGRRTCKVCRATNARALWSESDDHVLRIAHAKGRSSAVIAGMLDRTEADVTARIGQLGLGHSA